MPAVFRKVSATAPPRVQGVDRGGYQCAALVGPERRRNQDGTLVDPHISEAILQAGAISPMPIGDAIVHVPFPYQFPLLIWPVASQTISAVGETRALISGKKIDGSRSAPLLRRREDE